MNQRNRVRNLRRSQKALEEQIENITYKSDEDVPEGYKAPKRFGVLGNFKYRSSFIAVVYIAGNVMANVWIRYGKSMMKSRRNG